MINDIEQNEPITDDELDEHEQKIEVLMDRAYDFLAEAGAINDRALDNDPRPYTPLDNQPYGEELIRVKEAVCNLKNALSRVGDLRDMDSDLRLKEQDDFRELVEDVEGTIDDCTSNFNFQDDEADGVDEGEF